MNANDAICTWLENNWMLLSIVGGLVWIAADCWEKSRKKDTPTD